jgi:hypothetical protein
MAAQFNGSVSREPAARGCRTVVRLNLRSLKESDL